MTDFRNEGETIVVRCQQAQAVQHARQTLKKIGIDA